MYLCSHQLTLLQTQALDPNRVDAKSHFTHQIPMPAIWGLLLWSTLKNMPCPCSNKPSHPGPWQDLPGVTSFRPQHVATVPIPYFLSKPKGNRADCSATSKEWRNRFLLVYKSSGSLHILFPLSS